MARSIARAGARSEPVGHLAAAGLDVDGGLAGGVAYRGSDMASEAYARPEACLPSATPSREVDRCASVLALPASARCAARYDREIARLAIPAFGALDRRAALRAHRHRRRRPPRHAPARRPGGGRRRCCSRSTRVFIFLAYGTTAAVSRLLGAGDEREAAHQAVQSLWLALVDRRSAWSLLGLVLAEPLVGAAWAPRGRCARNALSTCASACSACRRCWSCWPAPATSAACRTPARRSPSPSAPGVLNLVLELVLIYGLGHGHRRVGAVDRRGPVGRRRRSTCGASAGRRGALGVDLRPHPASLRRLGAGRARDLLVRTAALRAALLVATAVATRIGPVDVAAHQIAFEIWSFLALALDAIAIAGQAIVGRFLGAGDADGGPAAPAGG